MDPKEHLQTMLTSLINGNDAQAREAVHQYIVNKSQEIANRPPAPPAED